MGDGARRAVKGWLFTGLGAGLLLSALALAPLAAARPGTLDRGFGSDGVAVASLGSGSGSAWPRAVVVQPDGRAVVASSNRILRFQWDGERDRGFAERDLPVADLVGLPGGGLVRLGGDELERLLPDGARDPGFAASSDGTVSVPGLRLDGLAVDSTGRLIAVGHDDVNGVLAVARFLPDGQLDPGFGSGGIARTAVTAPGSANLDIGSSVAVDARGRILVGASVGQAEGECVPFMHCWGPYLDGAMLRFLPDGSLDSGFGKGGTVRFDSTWGSVNGVVARPGGGALFIPGGPTGAAEPGSTPPFVIAALTSQGQMDKTFSGDGVSERRGRGLGNELREPFASELAVTPRGRIVAAGGIFEPQMFLVEMLEADGGPVRTFGRGGLARTRMPGKRSGTGAALALAPQGKVYVAGALGRTIALARYRLN